MNDPHPVRLAIEIKGGRPSDQQLLLQSLVDGIDEVLELDDAGIKAASTILDEKTRSMFAKMETQRKRIAYLESQQPPPKKRGPKPKSEQ